MIPDLTIYVYNHPNYDLVAVKVEWESKGKPRHLLSTLTKSNFQLVAPHVISALVHDVMKHEKEKDEK